VAISSYWLNLSLGSASRSSCHIDRVARLSSSEHETTRNLCAAHLLCIKRRNREAGIRLRRPRGVMPERLFYGSRRASSFESDIIQCRRDAYRTHGLPWAFKRPPLFSDNEPRGF
jgi:hypothetical protein